MVKGVTNENKERHSERNAVQRKNLANQLGDSFDRSILWREVLLLRIDRQPEFISGSTLIRCWNQFSMTIIVKGVTNENKERHSERNAV